MRQQQGEQVAQDVRPGNWLTEFLEQGFEILLC
jgi:hypothetical protein